MTRSRYRPKKKEKKTSSLRARSCAGRSSLWLSSFSFYFPPWSRSSLSQSFSINSHTLLSWRKSVFWLTDSVWVLPCKLLIRSFFTFSLTLTHHNCHLLVTIKAYWKVPLGSTLKGNHIIIQHILHYCIRVWTSITWTWKDQPLRPERPSLLVTQKSFLQLRHYHTFSTPPITVWLRKTFRNNLWFFLFAKLSLQLPLTE